MHVVEKDTINWMDFSAMVAEEIVHGNDQALEVTFFDVGCSYVFSGWMLCHHNFVYF